MRIESLRIEIEKNADLLLSRYNEDNLVSKAKLKISKKKLKLLKNRNLIHDNEILNKMKKLMKKSNLIKSILDNDDWDFEFEYEKTIQDSDVGKVEVN